VPERKVCVLLLPLFSSLTTLMTFISLALHWLPAYKLNENNFALQGTTMTILSARGRNYSCSTLKFSKNYLVLGKISLCIIPVYIYVVLI
jgi:hypothetical protein